MKVNIDSLSDFNKEIGFWSGAKYNWDGFTDDEKDYLEDYLFEAEFDSLTQINDFVWFDALDIIDELKNNF